MEGTITPASVPLLASFFSFSLGLSSKSKLFFLITIPTSFVFAVCYAISFTPNFNFNRELNILSCSIIFFSGIYHISERHTRHIEDKEYFFSWWHSKEEIQEKQTSLDSYRYQLFSLEEDEEKLRDEMRNKENDLSRAIGHEDKRRTLKREIKRLEDKILKIQNRYPEIEKKILDLDMYIESNK
ncbi:MAG: hypothetical protein SD837_06660 [Candidatus Electrothrix scaldis]|nr:MAG: hypothetical protein SD837_06660 [Candidatus Electrothrix sp. GW3-3]